MAFIYEQVPEQDREFLESMGLKHWDGRRLNYFSKYADWTADRERNAYLIGIGGGLEGVPLMYDLWWNGFAVRIECDRCGSKGNVVDGYHVVWNIQKIAVTDELWEKREQVAQLVREGFLADSYHNPLDVKSITVNINCEPTHAKEGELSGCYVSRN